MAAPAGITSRGEDTFFNANGNYATWNNYTLDGADNNSFSTNLQERSPQVVQPPVDALQEFKVQTRTYSAEFGKAAGAVINASVKQGSNAIRGSAYEFFRDEAFNANTWDNNRANRPKGEFNQHIAGFTLGGPILRNRTFFFGDYQATRTDRALSQTATVPTMRMRTGDLSELTGAVVASNPVRAGRLLERHDPGRGAARASTRWRRGWSSSTPSRTCPAPASSTTTSSPTASSTTTSTSSTSASITMSAAAATTSSSRYSYQQTDRVEPPILNDPVASGDFASNYLIRGQNLVAGWSHIFGSSALQRVPHRLQPGPLRRGASGLRHRRQRGVRDHRRARRTRGSTAGCRTCRSRASRGIGGPFFRPQYQTSEVFQFAENLTWTKGTHAMKFGVERRRDLVTYIDLRSLNGELSFNDGRYTGLGLGDFLLGLSSVQRLTLFHQPDLYADGWQFYAQDSWRIRDDLTVNLGLRYERFTPLLDRNDLLTNIDPATGEIVLASDGSTSERALVNPDANDFAPRLGASWNPAPRLVVRGGYGVFYQQTDRYGSESQLGLNLPQLVDAAISANSGADPPAFTFRQGFTPLNAETVNRSVVQWRIQDPNQDTPIVHQFSIGPEYQLTDTMVAGGRVRRQPHPQRPAAAQPEPGGDPAGQQRRLPLRAVRLRQCLPRADREQRPRRLRLAAGADAEADERRAGLHPGLHLERRRRATSSTT